MKLIATVEIEIPEAEAGVLPEQHGDAFKALYDLWHPLDLAKIKEAIAHCLTDEHRGICEYKAARVLDAKTV